MMSDRFWKRVVSIERDNQRIYNSIKHRFRKVEILYRVRSAHGLRSSLEGRNFSWGE